MRFAALSDRINNVDKHVEDLRLDMQAAIHTEFLYLVNKMSLTKQQHTNSENSELIDYSAK
jgi:hypothetical protein